jgi:hypothetical protein
MYTDQESMDVNSTTSIPFNNVMQEDIFARYSTVLTAVTELTNLSCFAVGQFNFT